MIKTASAGRLGTFLDDEIKTGPIVVRSEDHHNVVRFSGNDRKQGQSTLYFFSLGADKKDRHMEPFVIEARPRSGEPSLSRHEGEEFLYILQGVVEVIYGKDTFRLHEVRAAKG